MTGRNSPCDEAHSALEANPQLSCTVRAVAHVSDCIARGVALCFLIVASAFSALTPEPLWVRVLSFVVFGLVPAVAGYLVPSLISWTLRGACMLYDSVAQRFRRSSGPIKRGLSALLDFTRVAFIYFASALETSAKLLGLMCLRALAICAQVLDTYKAFASYAAACLCSAAHHYSRVVGKRIVMSMTFPIRLSARLLLELFPPAAGHEYRQPRAGGFEKTARRIGRDHRTPRLIWSRLNVTAALGRSQPSSHGDKVGLLPTISNSGPCEADEPRQAALDQRYFASNAKPSNARLLRSSRPGTWEMW
jgi:hypothetical protein